ncbi:hypothetical protein FA15DRAFT_674350 [Coprinopsis marcescibilis]|uniref:Uncharacterized protein n=1 Tax=Coprinopsis marcescibilis TaxID=230819 RepID=A0A5C3KHM1_COPMA|nr:hypothetical protein FA15DRAFT_674350 [Coprinopsis marcescibilis]
MSRMLKILIPIAYAVVLTILATSQFFPGSPIFIYLLSFHSSQFFPLDVRPSVSVSLLPTLPGAPTASATSPSHFAYMNLAGVLIQILFPAPRRGTRSSTASRPSTMA